MKFYKIWQRSAFVGYSNIVGTFVVVYLFRFTDKFDVDFDIIPCWNIFVESTAIYRSYPSLQDSILWRKNSPSMNQANGLKPSTLTLFRTLRVKKLFRDFM